jgi:hypothetical protein
MRHRIHTHPLWFKLHAMKQNAQLGAHPQTYLLIKPWIVKKNGARQSHKKLKRCTLLWNIKAKAKANMFELTRASTIIILLFYSICRARHFLTKVC